MATGIINIVRVDCVGIGSYDFSGCFGLCLMMLIAVVVMVAVVLLFAVMLRLPMPNPSFECVRESIGLLILSVLFIGEQYGNN